MGMVFGTQFHNGSVYGPSGYGNTDNGPIFCKRGSLHVILAKPYTLNPKPLNPKHPIP